MKIAIVGAGFSGLAACTYLSLRSHAEIVVYDSVGIAGGASGVAAGLLHPFAGPEAKLNWKAREGISNALDLLEVSSRYLGSPVYQKSGIVRLARTEEQKTAFKHCADLHDDVEWLEKVTIPGAVETEGIFISSGISVNCLDYLEGLWKACAERGCRFVQRQIQNPEELKDFDAVIFAAGAQVNRFAPVKLHFIKGQILRLEWPSSLPPLNCPLVSKKYIVMHPDLRSCWVGSTYEKKFHRSDVDIETARAEILPEAVKMIPELAQCRIIDCQAGIRAFTPQRRPLLQRIDHRFFALAGMGSKGLLYHAMMAKQLDSSLNSS